MSGAGICVGKGSGVMGKMRGEAEAWRTVVGCDSGEACTAGLLEIVGATQGRLEGGTTSWDCGLLQTHSGNTDISA